MRINHPSEREFGFMPWEYQGIEQRFYCIGSGNSSSSSPTTDNRNAATNDARLSAGSSVQADSGSVGVTGSGNATAPGGLGVTGSNARDITFTSSDPQVLQLALQQISTMAGNQASALAGYLTEVNKSRENESKLETQSLSSILGSISGLAQSQQTQGDSLRNNTVLIVVISVMVAVVAIFFIWKRK